MLTKESPTLTCTTGFDDVSKLEAGEVKDWLKTAHQLVAAKLTKKQRAELGL